MSSREDYDTDTTDDGTRAYKLVQVQGNQYAYVLKSTFPAASSSLLIEDFADVYNYSSVSDYKERWNVHNVNPGTDQEYIFQNDQVQAQLAPDTEQELVVLGSTSLASTGGGQSKLLNAYPDRDMVHSDEQYDGYAYTKIYDESGDNASTRFGFFKQAHGFETDGYEIEIWQEGEDATTNAGNPQLLLKKYDGGVESTLDSTSLSSYTGSAHLFVTFSNGDITARVIDNAENPGSVIYGEVSATDNGFTSGGWMHSIGIIKTPGGADLGLTKETLSDLKAVRYTVDDGPPLWETAADWDNAISESGVVHESTTNTDHGDATILKMGYPYGAFDAIGPTPHTAYPLHENSGTTAHAFGGDPEDGTYNGPTLGQTGLLGTSAPSFDGSDDYIELPISAFTADVNLVSFWCRPEDGTNAQTVVEGEEKMRVTWNDLADNGFSVEVFGDDDGGNLSPTGLSLNTWHFCCAYFDAASEIGMSVNGSAFSTVNSFVSDDFTNTARIGANKNNSENFDGRIADVRIYGSTISSSDAQTLYDTVDTAGSLTTGAKRFDSAQSPNLTADVSLNGVASFDVDVIGTPDGSSETNTVTVDTDGENTYSITWSSSHERFRVNPKPDNRSDYEVTPTINKLELVT